MIEHIFGRHLVDIGKITKEQMNTTIARMDSVRVKLGLIAVSEGFMTLNQADEVNRLQATRDMRFGDIAVEMGYLSQEQVIKLLKLQGNTYLAFAQALVDEELIKLEELEELLEGFRKKNGYSNTELEDIKSDIVERIVPIMIPESCKQYEDIVGLFMRTLVRLVDRHASIGKAERVTVSDYPALAIQRMQGDGTAMLADYVVAGDGALQVIASRYGRYECTALDEDALDSLGELLNCVNGLYATEQSKTGAFWELLPQEYSVDGIQMPEVTGCKVPVYVGNVMCYLVVSRLA